MFVYITHFNPLLPKEMIKHPLNDFISDEIKLLKIVLTMQ